MTNITDFKTQTTNVEGTIDSTNQPGWKWSTQVFNPAEFESWVASLDVESDSYIVICNIQVVKQV